MQHPCRLMIPGTGEIRRFDAVAFLADHLHTLRQLRPITTIQATVTSDDFAGSGLIVRYADEAGGTLGVVVIGEPDYAAQRQDELLTGALYRLDPMREVA